MRRFFAAILSVFLLATTVSAAGTVTEMQTHIQAGTDGECQVSLSMQISVSATDAGLTFPLPETAYDVYLNGHAVRSPLEGDHRHIDLSDVVPGVGVYTVNLVYSLRDSTTWDEEDRLILQFALLSGFAYPIEKLHFTVQLPGQPEFRPTFTSTYYQETADSLLDVTLEGNTVSAELLQPLKDLESLTFTLQISEDMFPQSRAKRWQMSSLDMVMLFLAVLALGYWLLTMRCLLPRRQRRTQPPEGLTAGELGCCLSGQGVDFSMLVLSWAQLGYLQITLTRNGRVLLHKRMDMGNERSDFEMRYFSALFGRRETVDGTGFHYARLCQKAGRITPNIRNCYLRGSGNPKILRGICGLIGLLAGISLATAFANDTVWQVVLSILLAPLTLIGACIIHSGARALHLRRKQMLYLGLLVSGSWFLLGLWAGQWFVALLVILVQWLCGLGIAYGGRRSEQGRQYLRQILGLRRHLSRVKEGELSRILEQNPDYYYALAPYAMALGVDRAFAKQFGRQVLPGCVYLVTDPEAPGTAREWNQRLRQVVHTLDDRQQGLTLKSLIGR